MSRIRTVSLLLVFLGIAEPPASRGAGCDPRNILTRTLTDDSAPALDLIPKEVPLRALNRGILREIQGGTQYSYYVDTLDQIHFVPGAGTLEGQGGFLTLKAPHESGVRIIKESGSIRYDPTTRKFLLESKNGWELPPGEIDSIVKRIEKENPEFRLQRKKNPRRDRALTLNCLEILSKSKGGKTFLLDNLIAYNTVAAAGVVTQELSGNPLLSDPESRKLVISDLIGNNASMVITSPVMKRVLISDAGIARDFATRTASDYLTNVFVKQPITNAVAGSPMVAGDESEVKSIGERLVPYDTGFSVVRFLPKRALDRALLNRVPEALTEACLGGNELAATIGPSMIRITDRYTWSLIYLTGRNRFLETSE